MAHICRSMKLNIISVKQVDKNEREHIKEIKKKTSKPENICGGVETLASKLIYDREGELSEKHPF